MQKEITKSCTSCSSEHSTYKCPACSAFYCSVNCYRTHKKNCQPPPTQPKEPPPEEETFITENTVPREKLQLLSKDKTIKDLLTNPHLRQLLKDIDGSRRPDLAMERAMLEPIFTELADACLEIVEPKEHRRMD